ncbi:YkoF family thiamine/hydroxymethylpyrimidine-binding protein [Enterococcus casseliflavus]|uniref:YkoF family thiamine/hydroxymethylpyrimidine-binding protein n=1 Tax=Enterococcus casseliflavus TaxID=37734 RepID=UPI0035D910DF
MTNEPIACAVGGIDITGCRVSLYPMKDHFAQQIVASIERTDTTAVWQQTDLFSTLFRGEAPSVVDAAAGLFINAYESKTHLVGEFTFSKGCPGDSAGDAFLNGEQAQPNKASNLVNGTFDVDCKYSFYVFGENNYMKEISTIVQLAETYGLAPRSAHYVTMLTGTANQLFGYFEAALAYAHDHLPHYVLEATVSVNSPSKKKAVSHD